MPGNALKPILYQQWHWESEFGVVNLFQSEGLVLTNFLLVIDPELNLMIDPLRSSSPVSLRA